MQEIFILRHAQAEDLKDNQTDFDRVLTEEGKIRTKKLGLFFNSIEEGVDVVLSSPYLRAKETANIFVSNVEKKPELKFVDFLSCGSSIKEIAKGLLPYSSFNKVLLVGHAPDLEVFLGKLVGAERITLKKGAIAKVILDNSIELSGNLVWLITSKIIKKFKIKEKNKDLNFLKG